MMPVGINSGLSSLVHLVMTMLLESVQTVMGMSMSLVLLMAVYPVIAIWVVMMLLLSGLMEMEICLILLTPYPLSP